MLTLPRFEVLRPRALGEALDAMAKGAVALAGGTDLVPSMKRGLAAPARLVSVRRLPELAGIAVDENGHLVLGAATTLAAIARDPRVREGWPAIAEAAELAASPPIRNVATLGGNVCLDTRCAYVSQSAFWRGANGPCLKTGGDVCHVLTKGQRCVAAFSADLPPVLLAYGARLVLASPREERDVALDRFYTADGACHVLREPDELITRVRVPRPAPRSRAAYVKIRPRAAIDFPALSIALLVSREDDGAVRDLTVVVGALGPKPRIVDGLAPLAVGRPLGARSIEAIAARVREACRPLDNVDVDADWRRAVLPVHVRRALEAMA